MRLVPAGGNIPVSFKYRDGTGQYVDSGYHLQDPYRRDTHNGTLYIPSAPLARTSGYGCDGGHIADYRPGTEYG